MKYSILIPIAFLLLLGGCSQSEPPKPKGIPITISWSEAKTPETAQVREALMKAQFTSIVEGANKNLVLPEKLQILFQDKDGPLYDRKQKVIFFSYNFVEETRISYLENGFCKTDEEALAEAVDAAEFIFLHEFTHAIIDILQLPILAPEEDIADGLASILAEVVLDSPELALAAAGSLHSLKHSEPKESAYWSRHSLDETRYYRILGLAYGSNPERVGPMIRERALAPEQWWKERADSYAKDFEKLRTNWHRVLQPHRAKDSNLPEKL